MREIKFRAINKDGEFIYGLPYTDGVNETTYYAEYNNRLCWRDENGAHCNQPYKNGTLEQYTGLKDKNGREIYEGDVVYLAGYGDLVVDDFGFDLWDSVKSGHSDDIGETIGNIHGIPELLK